MSDIEGVGTFFGKLLHQILCRKDLNERSIGVFLVGKQAVWLARDTFA